MRACRTSPSRSTRRRRTIRSPSARCARPVSRLRASDGPARGAGYGTRGAFPCWWGRLMRRSQQQPRNPRPAPRASRLASRAPHPAPRTPPPNTLRARLENLYRDYNREDAAADPIQIVKRYANPADLEVVGFCAAALAFGRVASVLNTVETLAAVLGPAPAAYVRGFDPAAPHPELRAMVHRWTRGLDIVAPVCLLPQIIERAGTSHRFFA